MRQQLKKSNSVDCCSVQTGTHIHIRQVIEYQQCLGRQEQVFLLIIFFSSIEPQSILENYNYKCFGKYRRVLNEWEDSNVTFEIV